MNEVTRELGITVSKVKLLMRALTLGHDIRWKSFNQFNKNINNASNKLLGLNNSLYHE